MFEKKQKIIISGAVTAASGKDSENIAGCDHLSEGGVVCHLINNYFVIKHHIAYFTSSSMLSSNRFALVHNSVTFFQFEHTVSANCS